MSAEVLSHTQDEIWNDLKMTTFTVKNPYQHIGKYFCSTSEGIESLNQVEFIETQSSIWSQWSEWGKCELVGEEIVKRVRFDEQNKRRQIQKRFCRCSDLKELPRPRYVHILGIKVQNLKFDFNTSGTHI